MKKILHASLVFILSVLMYVSSVNLLFALPYKIGEFTGNEKDLGVLNDLIDKVDSALPDITSVLNKVEVGGDSKTYEFTNLSGINYLTIKSGNLSELWYLHGVDSWIWTSPIQTLSNGKNQTLAISNYTSYGGATPVPEPTTALLLGIGLAGIIVAGRKKMKS